MIEKIENTVPPILRKKNGDGLTEEYEQKKMRKY